MSIKTLDGIAEYLEDLYDIVEMKKAQGSVEPVSILLEEGSHVDNALGLALAVLELIEFGGGLLRINDDMVFKFIRPCQACEVAAPMITPGAILSKFCARCANDLAGKYQELQK